MTNDQLSMLCLTRQLNHLIKKHVKERDGNVVIRAMENDKENSFAFIVI